MKFLGYEIVLGQSGVQVDAALKRVDGQLVRHRVHRRELNASQQMRMYHALRRAGICIHGAGIYRGREVFFLPASWEWLRDRRRWVKQRDAAVALARAAFGYGIRAIQMLDHCWAAIDPATGEVVPAEYLSARVDWRARYPSLGGKCRVPDEESKCRFQGGVS